LKTYSKVRIKTYFDAGAPVCSQIMNQEQIEMRMLSKFVKLNGETVPDKNKDAMLVDDIQLKGYFWDSKNKVPKYKIEYGKEKKLKRPEWSKHCEQKI
jgi:hypothetical protein